MAHSPPLNRGSVEEKKFFKHLVTITKTYFNGQSLASFMSFQTNKTILK